MALGQHLVALVNIKIAGKWVFTPLTLIIIGFDTHPSNGSRCLPMTLFFLFLTLSTIYMHLVNLLVV